MTITAERPTAVVTSQTPPDVRLSTELTLVAVSTAVGCAGRLVRCTLQDWGIGRTEVKAAELRTAELATNAVQAIAASHRVHSRVELACGYALCDRSGSGLAERLIWSVGGDRP